MGKNPLLLKSLKAEVKDQIKSKYKCHLGISDNQESHRCIGRAYVCVCVEGVCIDILLRGAIMSYTFPGKKVHVLLSLLAPSNLHSEQLLFSLLFFSSPFRSLVITSLWRK